MNEFSNVNWIDEAVGMEKSAAELAEDMDTIIDTSKSFASQQAYGENVAKLAEAKQEKTASDKTEAVTAFLDKLASTEKGAAMIAECYKGGMDKAVEQIKATASK